MAVRLHASTRAVLSAVLLVLTASSAVAQAPAAAQAAAPQAAARQAAARYVLDPAKSSLDYQFVQAGAQNKGRFTRMQVSLQNGSGSPAGGKLDVVVDVRSLDTGDSERDDTLRGADLFDVTKFPEAHFSSTQITQTTSGFDAAGKLTIRNVTRDVHVPFTFRVSDEQGKATAYLAGKLLLHRLDYGVGQGDWKSTEWVGNEVTVSYSLRLLPSP
ncbi:MAG: YceI family protein [Sinobacteraceae bacterium]|nr:YceI family protein [Nevskiaceae bacterium]